MTYPSRLIRPFLRVTSVTLLCHLICASLSFAANATKEVTFDIPADSAVKALRLFSAQSGQQLIYANSDLAGVNTNEVKGKFGVKEALNRLLAGTPLIASGDSKNGAVAVNRMVQEKPDPNGTRAAPTQGDRPLPNDRELREAVRMNPFVVDTSRDNGFVAASSLAGGRLASDLATTPVAYSVLTRDFLDALGITDVNSASLWTVNSASTQDQGQAPMIGGHSTVSLRGGTTAATTRDFFSFGGNYDSYNLERVDYARGANAILFGNSDYSGTINSVSRQARTSGNFGQLRLDLGS